jgi:hypothetical protein
MFVVETGLAETTGWLWFGMVTLEIGWSLLQPTSNKKHMADRKRTIFIKV